MIFFQTLVFIFSSIFLSLSISGYGMITYSNIKKNFFLDIFLGLIVISLIITFVHFFYKINLLLAFFIFLTGIGIFFYKKNFSFLGLLKTKNIYYFLIFFLLVPIFLSQKYHEDFGYYHLPYALSLIEEKIIFGFANIDKPYVYNSIWLNLYSIFFLNDKNFNFLTFPSFLLFLSLILFSLNQLLSKKEKTASEYFLLITLFYFILKFTRISEFGVDLPAVIFSILAIYYFLKFSESNIKNEKHEYFFLVAIFSIFSFLIKLSTIPVGLLPLFLFLKYFKDLKFDIFRLKFLLIYFLLITFFTQQFIYTGCLFFPNKLTCLDVSWLNIDNINLSKELELTNKGYSSQIKEYITPGDYLKDYNWFGFWLKRSFIEILEHSLTIILPVMTFLFFQKRKINSNFILKDKLGLYLFLILGLLFWLNYSPVYRFAIHLFLILFFLIFIRYLLLINFSKKFFLFFVMAFVFFSFSKNILRLNKAENIFLGIKKIDNQYLISESTTIQTIKVYKPDIKKNTLKNGWQGRLCWNIPFICSYNSLDVKEKNGYLIINKLSN